MKLVITLAVFVMFAGLVFGADTAIDHYKSGQYYDERYNRRYYKNRPIYNQRGYYSNFYKRYNPDVESHLARIIHQSTEPIKKDGSYSYVYETENGIHNEAYGTATILDKGNKALKVVGAFSFVTPEGLRVGVQYVADERGYRPIITYDGTNAEQFTRSQPAANVGKAKNF